MHDAPWFLQEAINHALSVIAWHENNLPEDLPHENLWDDAEAIDEHFKAVQMKKDLARDGYSVSDDPEEDSGMTQNQLSSVFKE